MRSAPKNGAEPGGTLMKRMLCLLLCAVLLLASCGSKMPAPIPMPELAGSPELSMEVVSMESTWRKKTVTVRLTNRMDHTLLYGRTYQLLRYDGTDRKSVV